MQIIKKILFLLTLLLFLMILILALWLMYQRNRDPLTALDRNSSYPNVTHQQSQLAEFLFESRIYEQIGLFSEDLDSFRITISRPVLIPAEGLPVLIVVGGWESGFETFNYFTKHAENILIAYQPPAVPESWAQQIDFFQLPRFNETLMKIPAQLEGLARWAISQSWSDRNRVSFLAYHFGALLVPAAYHLAATHQLNLGPAVLAYGGVDLYHLLHHNLKARPSLYRTVTSWMAAMIIFPVEPAHHLPYMRGEFLVVSGRRDERIPEPYWKKYQELTPAPKNIMILDSGSLDPGKMELMQQVFETSRKWLIQRNAINP